MGKDSKGTATTNVRQTRKSDVLVNVKKERFKKQISESIHNMKMTEI